MKCLNLPSSVFLANATAIPGPKARVVWEGSVFTSITFANTGSVYTVAPDTELRFDANFIHLLLWNQHPARGMDVAGGILNTLKLFNRFDGWRRMLLIILFWDSKQCSRQTVYLPRTSTLDAVDNIRHSVFRMQIQSSSKFTIGFHFLPELVCGKQERSLLFYVHYGM